jgi:hypothetical protein
VKFFNDSSCEANYGCLNNVVSHFSANFILNFLDGMLISSQQIARFSFSQEVLCSYSLWFLLNYQKNYKSSPSTIVFFALQKFVGRMENDYVLIEKIGEGAFGKVITFSTTK